MNKFWTDKYINLSKDLENNKSAVSDKITDFFNDKKFDIEEYMLQYKYEIYPNKEQLEIFDKWFSVSNYVYNKTIDYIKKGVPINFITLRNLLVSEDTKTTNTEYIKIAKEIKDLKNIKTVENSDIDIEIKKKLQELKDKIKNIKPVKNTNVNKWELEVPKDIRADTVKEVCTAYKSALANLKNGNIKDFKVSYRKKNNNKLSLPITLQSIKVKDGQFQLFPTYLKKNKFFKTSINIENLEIKNDCKLLRQNGQYYVCVPFTDKNPNFEQVEKARYCGIDPGIRTFLTCYSSEISESLENSVEYKANFDILNKLNTKKINIKKNKKPGKRLRKKVFYKIERKKENQIKELHDKTIRSLLDNNDIIFYGDIQSHDIVKNKDFQTKLNTNTNDLKFYQFKQKLLSRAKKENKLVYEVQEPYTTKTCSNCGEINCPGSSKIYKCSKCNMVMDRDKNASKNILMKGLVETGIF